jgi:polyisoprenoid-binding protein YceI
VADDAPPPLTVGADQPSDAAPFPSSPGPDGADAIAELDGGWTVGSDSLAGYRVDEVLNGQNVTVVGRTDDVSGTVQVTDGQVTDGRIEVDMTTVRTDSGSRDGQFQGMIMDTARFPTSTFTLTEPLPLGPLEAGDRATATVRGDLTIRDVTRDLAATVTVQRDGDAVQVAGSIPITFSDFDVEAPDLGFVKVEDAGEVEFFLVLNHD